MKIQGSPYAASREYFSSRGEGTDEKLVGDSSVAVPLRSSPIQGNDKNLNPNQSSNQIAVYVEETAFNIG